MSEGMPKFRNRNRLVLSILMTTFLQAYPINGSALYSIPVAARPAIAEILLVVESWLLSSIPSIVPDGVKRDRQGAK